MYKVGTRVLVKNFLRYKRKGGKLDDRWMGPYIILKNLGKGSYLLQEEKSKVERKVNGAHMKAFYVSYDSSKNLTKDYSSKEATPESDFSECNEFSRDVQKETFPEFALSESEYSSDDSTVFANGEYYHSTKEARPDSIQKPKRKLALNDSRKEPQAYY